MDNFLVYLLPEQNTLKYIARSFLKHIMNLQPFQKYNLIKHSLDEWPNAAVKLELRASQLQAIASYSFTFIHGIGVNKIMIMFGHTEM